MDVSFTHLHCHSHYSLLDGAGKIPDLLKRAKELGMTALALTDHGNLYGVLEFYQKAKELDIKPIIGYEAYVAPGSRFEKSTNHPDGLKGKIANVAVVTKNHDGGDSRLLQSLGDDDAAPVSGSSFDQSLEIADGPKDKTAHLTLLAMNQVGYRNLLKLSSLAFLEGYYYRPRIDKALLETYHEGLICLSGCASSELSRALRQGELDRAKNIAKWFRNLFGDRYYIEIQDNGLDIQKVILEEGVKIAKELGIPTVATNDVHYVNKNDAKPQDILLCINTGKLLSDEKRMRMETDQFYLRSGREMLKAMPGQDDAIERTMEIAERVNVELELGKRYFPSFTPPANMTSDKYLRKLCIKGLKKRYKKNPKRFKDGKLSKEVIARLKRELKVIKKQGFSNYFLIVWDFVREAEARGIHRTARGSGVGALVCYALNMSHVCPLKFDLLFERFLDENRREPPDIDIDFDKDRRGEILDYAREKYGADNVAQIGTFGKLAAKQSIKDVGRVLGMPIPEVESVTKLVPPESKITIKEVLDQSQELLKRYQTESEITELIDDALKLEGLVRQSGVHACAVVIADKPLTEYMPLQNVKDAWKKNKNKDGGTEILTDIVTQWAMGDVERAGLLKMDFLGLRNLSILAQVIGIIEQTTGKKVNPYRFPLNDKKTFGLLGRGETKGVFQLESGGMRDLLHRMKPDCFHDIIATLALYRPGPLEGGMVDQYVRVKHRLEKAEYLHSVLEEVLTETHGVMVYQEQIMRILNRLGNIPLADSYSCIKAISKKKEDQIEKNRQQFIEGAASNGLDKEKASDIFGLIIKFAGYGFNKSHSTAYALVAYMTAYLKAHYPVEFMAALLCGDISKRNLKSKDSTVEHIEDCKRMGIEIVKPDINDSDPLYSVKDGKILFALTAIKGCGQGAAENIVKARNEGGPFKSLFDFCDRTDLKACPRATIEQLIKVGAFDSLGCRRSQLLQAYEAACLAAKTNAESKARGQKSLLLNMTGDEDSPQDEIKNATAGLPDIPEWSEKEKALYEKEGLGFYLSTGPMEELERTFKMYRTHHCKEVGSLPADKQVIVAGTVTDVKLNMSKSGQYAMFNLEDSAGTVRAIIWSSQYEIYKQHIKNESAVFMTCRVDRSRAQTEDGANLIVDDVFTLEEAPQKLARGLSITLDETRHDEETAKKLHEILNGFPGLGELELSVRLKSGTLALLRCHQIRVAKDAVVYKTVSELLGEEFVRMIRIPMKTHQPKEYGNRYKRS